VYGAPGPCRPDTPHRAGGGGRACHPPTGWTSGTRTAAPWKLVGQLHAPRQPVTTQIIGIGVPV